MSELFSVPSSLWPTTGWAPPAPVYVWLWAVELCPEFTRPGHPPPPRSPAALSLLPGGPRYWCLATSVPNAAGYQWGCPHISSSNRLLIPEGNLSKSLAFSGLSFPNLSDCQPGLNAGQMESQLHKTKCQLSWGRSQHSTSRLPPDSVLWASSPWPRAALSGSAM